MMSERYCYCYNEAGDVVEKRGCDFCNGYRSRLCPELHCPRATRQVAAVLGVDPRDLVHMSAEVVRAEAPEECAALRAEVERRYPRVVEDLKKQGLWA